MTLQNIKNAMLKYEDFYGQDIVQVDLIIKAKTKKELKDILNQHRRFLEDQNIDAINHIEQFMRSLGIIL